MGTSRSSPDEAWKAFVARAKQEPRIRLIVVTIMVGLGLGLSTLDPSGPETYSIRLHLAQNMRSVAPPRPRTPRDAGQLALSTLKHLGRIDFRPGEFGASDLRSCQVGCYWLWEFGNGTTACFIMV